MSDTNRNPYGSFFKKVKPVTDKVKLDPDWLEQAIESSGRTFVEIKPGHTFMLVEPGRTFMEVKPCPDCKGTGKRRTRSRSINEQLIDRPCPNCKKGWVIK